MSSVAKVVGMYPPMANGPMPKPDGMSNILLKRVRSLSVPCAVAVAGIFAVSFYGTFYRRKQKIEAWMKTTNPDTLFEEIKEYGVFKSAKASWQE